MGLHGDIGKIAEPLNTLVEKCAGAGLVLYEPTRIGRRAKAKVDAERIRALGEVETRSLVDRAKVRERARLEREQQNLEAITSLAAAQLPFDVDNAETARVEKINDDWFALFLDKARLVSEEKVQEAWAKILAKEVTSPGSFSKQTLNCLANMEKGDAELYRNLCCLSIDSPGGYLPFFWSSKCPFATAFGLNFGSLQQLEAIGLITVVFSSFGGGPVVQQMPQKCEINYFGRRAALEFAEDDRSKWKIGHGYVRFTRAGNELRNISGPESVPGFLEDLIGKLNERKEVTVTMIGGE